MNNKKTSFLIIDIGERLCLWSLFCVGILSFFLVAAKNIALILFLISSLLLLRKDIFLKTLTKNLFVRFGICLFLLMFFGLFYSVAEFNIAFSAFVKYRRLLFPLLFIPVFYLIPRAKNMFLYGAAVGVSFRLLLSLYVLYFPYEDCVLNCPFNVKLHYNFYIYKIYINPIYSAFMANLGAFLALFLFKTEKNRKFLVIFSLFVIYLTFVNVQKTGFCLLAAWVIPWSILEMGRRKLVFLFLALSFVLIFFQYKNPLSPLSKTINSINELSTIESSIGSRLDLLKSCAILIKEKPFFGWGTGGITSSFVIKNLSYLYGEKATLNHHVNPHNQFALIFVELGLLGGAVFLLWLGTFFKDLYTSLIDHAKIWALCLGLFIIMAFFSDVMIFLNLTGDFLIIIFCIFYAEILRQGNAISR